MKTGRRKAAESLLNLQGRVWEQYQVVQPRSLVDVSDWAAFDVIQVLKVLAL